jgi:hypothetical protein
MDRLQRTVQRIDEFLPAASQPVVAPIGQPLGIRFSAGHRLQDAPPTQSQQIADYAGELDARFLQQYFQLALQPYPVADQLMLAPCHRSPRALLRVGHETQDQFVGEQTSCQSFGIAKIVLAAPRRSIRVGLCQMQLCEVWFQIQPHRLPVLRR